MPPSIWASSRPTVQFLAIVLAIVRPDARSPALYLDEWVDARGRGDHRLASAVDYLVRRSRSVAALSAGSAMARVFVTGGSGLSAARSSRAARARRRRSSRSRAPTRPPARSRAPRRRGRRAATCSTRTRSAAGMAGCDARLPRRGRQHAVPGRPRADAAASTSTAPRPRSAPPRAPASRASCITSSAATLGEAHGTVGTRGHRRTAGATCRSTSAPSTRASARRSRRRARRGVERRVRQPVLGPGAGPRRRHRRGSCIAYLNGRLKAFVDTRISLVDIATAPRATCSPPSAARPASATCSTASTLTSQRGAGDRRAS